MMYKLSRFVETFKCIDVIKLCTFNEERMMHNLRLQKLAILTID